MPSSNAAKVAKRMAKLSTEFSHAEKTAVKDAAASAKKILVDEIRNAAGGDLVLSKVGKSGGKLGVHYGVKTARDASTALVRATGPLHLLEHVSKPHTLIPHSLGRANGRTKAARRAAKQDLYNALFGRDFRGAHPLRFPWGWRFSANHPGVRRPKQPWKKGRAKSDPVVRKTIESAYESAFRRGVR